jgi:hypothetical protein
MSWRKESQNSKEKSNGDDFSLRIREISARIADLQSRFESNIRSNQVTSLQSQPMVAAPTEQTNSQLTEKKDIDDLKAKLLGKKK